MAIFYKGCDEVEIPPYVCDPCSIPENGRVRSVAFIEETFDLTEPIDKTEFTAGIESGEIVIIPKVIGQFDGGSPAMGAGYGNDQELLLGYDYVLNLRDAYYPKNGEFWDKIRLKKTFRVMFITDTQGHISDKPVTIVPKNPIQEDLKSAVEWTIEAKWFQNGLCKPFDIEAIRDVFRCFEIKP